MSEVPLYSSSLHRGPTPHAPGRKQRHASWDGERGSNVSGSGFRISRFAFRDEGFGFRAEGFGFRVEGFRFRVSGFGFRGEGVGVRNPQAPALPEP